MELHIKSFLLPIIAVIYSKSNVQIRFLTSDNRRLNLLLPEISHRFIGYHQFTTFLIKKMPHKAFYCIMNLTKTLQRKVTLYDKLIIQ